MIPTFYIVGFSLFGVGLALYIAFSLGLSRDIQSGAIPVRKDS